MVQSPIDRMIERATQCLATGDMREIGGLVHRLAREWPNEPALSVAFAMTCSAANLEDVIKDKDSARAAGFAYKLAALLAADIHAVQAMGQVPAKASDLLHFWRRVDPYFLNLDR
jgi:hypothetical protein